MILFILTAVIIGFVALVCSRKPRDPVYVEKTIEEWFDEVADKADSLYSSSSLSARDAFESFGARAQPFLLRWAQKKPPLLAKLRDRWLASLPKWMQPWPRKIHSQQWYVNRRRLALQMLGFVDQWERNRPGGNKHAGFQLATNALPPLTQALRDGDQTIRLTGAYALRNLGDNAWPAVPSLTESISDFYPQVAIVSIQTLGGLGPSASNAVPKLAAVACDPANALRTEAVKTLGAIGPTARSVSPKLASFLTNDLGAASARTAESVGQNDFDGLAERLRVLGGLPPKAIPVSGQPSASSRVGLLKLEPPDPLALKPSAGPVLSYGNPSPPMLISSDRKFRGAVADALVRIGEIPNEAAPALERMLQSEGPNRAALALAMWQRNPEDATVQRYVIATLTSDDWLHRMRATRLLGEVGTNAAVFLPELRRLLEDSQLLVRRCATSTVDRISATTP